MTTELQTDVKEEQSAKPPNVQALPQRVAMRPCGPIPSDTEAWLAVNEAECGWQIAVCKCGRWYHQMDHLAPYHTDMNWCPKCEHKQD